MGVILMVGGLAGAGAIAGSVSGWSSGYRNCGPAANYGESSN